MIDILTIGDSSTDLYMKISDEGVSDYGGKMCFVHGSKILVNQFDSIIGGNAVNVAVGCAMLGLKPSVYTELGRDDSGKRIVNELKSLRIDTRLCKLNKGKKTNIHTVIVHGGDRTIFSYHGKQEYKLANFPKTKWIYYTSLGHNFEDFQDKLCEYAKDNRNIGLAFNPGTVQMKAGLDKMRNMLRITDILFVNKDEAQTLVGSLDVLGTHKALNKLGPKLTVITNGKYGASGFDGADFEEVPPYSDPRPIADKTGAGDAFSSGFISAIFYDKPLKEALEWGAINSGNCIKIVGATKGLTNKHDMQNIHRTL